jgi:hypothetical protein
MGSVRVLFNPLHAREEPKFVHRNYAVKNRRLRGLCALKWTRSKYPANACSRWGHHQGRKSTNLKRTRRLLFPQIEKKPNTYGFFGFFFRK